MNKLNLLLMSLLVAVPGAILTILLVMAFLSYGGGANVAFQGLAALSLIAGALMTALPAGILVYSPGELFPAKAPKKKDAKKEAADEGDEGAELGSSGSFADEGLESADADELEEGHEFEQHGGPDFDAGFDSGIEEGTTPSSEVDIQDDLGSDMEISEFLDQSSVDEADMMVLEDSSTSEVEAFDVQDFDSDFDLNDDDDKPKKKKKK